MGLLSNAIGFVRRSHAKRDSFVIAYVPAGGSPFPTVARPGRSKTTLQSEETFGATIEGDDFLIRRENLVLLGRDPKRGDRIVRELGNATLTYEVLPTDGEPEWRWSDPAEQTEYRIHVKHVRTDLQ